MTKQSEDLEAIKRLAEDWRAGWLAGDAEALMYADDPVVMPWGQPAVFGKDAIRPLYQSVFKEYAIRSETRTATPKAGGASLEENGKSLFIVKREHGAWRIARLIDNSDRTQQAAN